MMASETDEELARLLRSPIRRDIWRRFLLSDQPLCAVDIAHDITDGTLPNVTYHVRILHSNGALEFTGREPRGGAFAYFYEIRDDPFDRELVLDAIESMGVDDEPPPKTLPGT